MDGSSGIVVSWAKAGGPGCATRDPIPPAEGVIPTLVVIVSVDACSEDQREHIGAVFYGYDPKAWACLSDTEVAAFQAWGTTAFPAVQIVTVTEPLPAINCPPPGASAAVLASLHGEAFDELHEKAPSWFVPATPAAVAKQVA